jgi:hypothetical protein
MFRASRCLDDGEARPLFVPYLTQTLAARPKTHHGLPPATPEQSAGVSSGPASAPGAATVAPVLTACTAEAVAGFAAAVGALAAPAPPESLLSVAQLLPAPVHTGTGTTDLCELRHRCRAIEPLLPWIQVQLQDRISDAVVVEACFLLLRRISWALDGNAPHLDTLHVMLAAMQRHLAVQAAVEHWLVVLRNLSVLAVNKVRTRQAQSIMCLAIHRCMRAGWRALVHVRPVVTGVPIWSGSTDDGRANCRG